MARNERNSAGTGGVPPSHAKPVQKLADVLNLDAPTVTRDNAQKSHRQPRRLPPFEENRWHLKARQTLGGAQVERRRPGRLASHAGETRRLILYYSRLLRATDNVLEELQDSQQEVREVVQEYREQFRSQIEYWTGKRERERRLRKVRGKLGG